MTRENIWHIVLTLSIALVSVVVGAFDAKHGIALFSFLWLAVYIWMHKGVNHVVVLAAIFALTTVIANDYTYDSLNIALFGISLFPFISWTGGLVLLHIVHQRVSLEIHPAIRWVLLSVCFFLTLLALEYIGYYLLDIRLASNYPSLFGLGVIHGPPFMHWFYTLAGPVFLLVTNVYTYWYTESIVKDAYEHERVGTFSQKHTEE